MNATERMYQGPNKPCRLATRNLGVRTGLPTCCRYHRDHATPKETAMNHDPALGIGFAPCPICGADLDTFVTDPDTHCEEDN